MKPRMTIILIAAVLVLIAASVLVWRRFFGVPNPPLPSAEVSVGSSSAPAGAASAGSTSTDVANPMLPEEKLSIDRGTWTVEMATTVTEQARGLSYRENLGENAGMLFMFSKPGIQSFWMKDMRFPLDMIWISGNGTVAGFAENVPAPAPGTALWNLPVYTSPNGVQQVLEVNAGSVARYNIKTGDKVTVSPL